MRVLLISHYFPPLNVVAAHRPYSWARTWTDMGHEVHVLTTEKYLVPTAFRVPRAIEGVFIHAVPYLPFVAAGGGPAAAGQTPAQSSALDVLRRRTRGLRERAGAILNPLTFAYWPLKRRGLELMAQKHFDFIVSTSGPEVCPMVASALARRHATPWLSDYRDLWTPEYAATRSSLGNFVARVVNERLIRRPAMVSTVSRGLADSLRPYHGDVIVSYNGFYDDMYRAGASTLKKEPQVLRIRYTGRLLPGKYDPQIFLDGLASWFAASPASRQRLKVEFFGARETWLERMVSERALGDVVEFRGSVSYEESITAQQDADVLLFIDWLDRRARGFLSGKLFEYFASGCPVLCVGNREDTEAVELIRACGAGWIATTPDEVRQHLVSALSGALPAQRNEEAIREFSRAAQARALMDAAQERLKVRRSA